MTIRPLIAALAFASLAAPLAAHADTPSGDINTVFAIDQAVKIAQPQFDRSAWRAYVEDTLPDPKSPVVTSVTREQVLKELAAMPLEKVGA
jgi:hypothetical protein